MWIAFLEEGKFNKLSESICVQECEWDTVQLDFVHARCEAAGIAMSDDNTTYVDHADIHRGLVGDEWW